MGLADQSCHDKSMPNIRLALPNMAKLIAHAVVHSLCPPVLEARTCPRCAAPACRKRSSSRRRGKTCTCLPYPARVCDRHFKLCRQHARVRPVSHLCAGAASLRCRTLPGPP